MSNWGDGMASQKKKKIEKNAEKYYAFGVVGKHPRILAAKYYLWTMNFWRVGRPFTWDLESQVWGVMMVKNLCMWEKWKISKYELWLVEHDSPIRFERWKFSLPLV